MGDHFSKLTDRAVDTGNPNSIASRARRKRWARFSAEFPDIDQMHVLDLGGLSSYWRNAPTKPEHVTIVNLHYTAGSEAITTHVGDACNPPAEVLNSRFDLVVSNSVLEHVGGHAQRQRMADVVHKLAGHHWVQTPYRYFPVEPHWLAPGMQFLPFECRVQLTQRWGLGHMQTKDRDTAIDNVNNVELIGLTQMRDYFPRSNVWTEKTAGLVKSMVAIL